MWQKIVMLWDLKKANKLKNKTNKETKDNWLQEKKKNKCNEKTLQVDRV